MSIFSLKFPKNQHIWLLFDSKAKFNLLTTLIAFKYSKLHYKTYHHLLYPPWPPKSKVLHLLIWSLSGRRKSKMQKTMSGSPLNDLKWISNCPDLDLLSTQTLWNNVKTNWVFFNENFQEIQIFDCYLTQKQNSTF